MMNEARVTHNFKIVAVGDGAVGKTCLLVSYAENRFPREYVPTIFDNYHANCEHEEEMVRLSIYDTAGQEDYDELRKLCYPGTDVFLICFSIDNPQSLRNVKNAWMKDLKENGPKDSKYILVGTKQDLREDATIIRELSNEGKHPVSYEEGLEVAKQIGAIQYMETSALHMRGVKEVFTRSIHFIMMDEKKSGKKRNKNKDRRSGLFSSSSNRDEPDEDLDDFARIKMKK